MKGYKRFIILILVLVAAYVVAEMNRPEQVQWNTTLSSKDKNPFGAFVLYQQLKDLFPSANINTYHLPVYNQLNNVSYSNTAYLLIEPAKLSLTHEDIGELLSYVADGNYAFIASAYISKELMDTFKLASKSKSGLINKENLSINFKNPALHVPNGYTYKRFALDEYFNRYDTANAMVLGENQDKDANFLKMPYGDGAFFLHPMPLCFSNDFLLSGTNAEYTATALSYLPATVHTLLWDEYYKQEEKDNQTPLKFILGNKWLRLAFRLGLVTMILFVLFEMKRRQQIIPVIAPLRNTTLDFVRTVGNVYFNNRDNQNIATKKISYFLETIRSTYNLSTSHLNDEFVTALSKKTLVAEEEISALVALFEHIQHEPSVTDLQLLELNRRIDLFNKKNNP